MKRTIIKFSVMLMIFLLSGVGSALALPSGPFSPDNVTIGNMSVIINYNGTGRPGDVLNITADFNKSVANATISITNNPSFVGASNANLVGASLPADVLMTPLGSNELGGNSFGYDFDMPDDIIGLFGVVITPFDLSGLPLDSNGLPGGAGIEFPSDGFGIDPYIDIISPTSEFANESCVTFNFTGNDYFGQAGDDIIYTFSLDGSQVNNGIIASGEYKQLEFTLADGKHTWEVQTNDTTGAHTTGVRTIYVDTQDPIITLTSPQDCFKQVIGQTEFNFTCEDALADQYSELGLSYVMYVDGQVAKRFGNQGTNITGTVQSGAAVNQKVQLTDGAHNWSVSVQDRAGNSASSEVRKFYVDLSGLKVSSLDPNNGKYVSANPTFNFTVTGGAGLPFNYRLLVDGKEIMKSNCDGIDCNGGYTGDEGEDGCDACVRCSEDGNVHCFVIGQPIYSLKAAVSDGVNKNWTVIISDITTGKEYQTNLQTFSVDSVAPCAVEQLYVADTPGETNWTELTNTPGLGVFWVLNEETDLASNPYEVYISTSKPTCIEDMEKVTSTAKDMPMAAIDKFGGNPLVYGKDYWVAVIARDNASNYDTNFSVYGPVQTYEDMNLNLTEGWNLKSVPKKLVDDCTESVFGPSTVLYWDGSCWQFPDTIEPCKAYWVYTNKSLVTNVKFKGMSGSGSPDVPPSLTLCPGWHMIGHSTTYSAPWSVTLASLNDFDTEIADDYRFSNLITYSEDEGWGGIIPGVEIDSNGQPNSDLTEPQPVLVLQSYGYMVPGQGYWIFVKDEGIYASIENVYNLNLGRDTNTGTDNGTGNGGLPDGFDPTDNSTWPAGWPANFDLSNQATWPAGFDQILNQFLNQQP